MKTYQTIIVIISLLSGCINQKEKPNPEVEILTIEQQFKDMAASEGLKKAFLYFADDSAVIVRNNRLYKGKDEIAAYYDEQGNTYTQVTLTWEPGFVDVSSCGDLAYTYGNYQFSATTKEGRAVESKGIFHTVWKKGKDRSWRFVYD